MAKFSKGEIAVVIKTNTGELLGEEVEIKSDLFMRTNHMVHRVENDKFFGWFRPDWLRKKKPPEEEINWMEKLNLKVGVEV